MGFTTSYEEEVSEMLCYKFRQKHSLLRVVPNRDADKSLHAKTYKVYG